MACIKSPSMSGNPAQAVRAQGRIGVLGRRQGLRTEGIWAGGAGTWEWTGVVPGPPLPARGLGPAPREALAEAVPTQSPFCPVQFGAEVQTRLSARCSCPKSNSVL